MFKGIRNKLASKPNPIILRVELAELEIIKNNKQVLRYDIGDDDVYLIVTVIPKDAEHV